MREKARFLAGFFVEWDKKEIEMLKADADYVAKDNNEHGFAQAVGRFVL